MMNHIPLPILAASLAILLAGCNEKPKAERVIENTRTSVQKAGAAIKHAAQKTGNIVGDTAENVWGSLKKVALEVSRVAANVAGTVKVGDVTGGETVKKATK